MGNVFQDFIINFTSILWEALPFIILGAIIAGILEEFLPQQALTRFLPKAAVPAVMIGAALGLLFPMCECGIVVVMRRLLRKGLPLSCCIAYMLAGPVINGVVIFSTWVAFRDHQIGPEMVGLRVGLAFLVATLTGFVVHLQYRRYGNALLRPLAVPVSRPAPTGPTTAPQQPERQPVPQVASSEPKLRWSQRLGNISATALHDFVDITVFLILGAVLAAAAKMYMTANKIQIEPLSREQPFIAIPAMMLLAFIMCLCSEADAFVAASFTRLHLSAKLAFLVLGPMLDIKLILMFTRVFRITLILTIVLTVATLVFTLTLSVHFIYQANNWTGLPPLKSL